MFILKSKRREVWGERQEIQVKNDWALLSQEERERRAPEAARHVGSDKSKSAAPRWSACGSKAHRRSSTTPLMVTNWPPAKPRNVPARNQMTTIRPAVLDAEDSARKHGILPAGIRRRFLEVPHPLTREEAVASLFTGGPPILAS
jgi:hypothetical protein